MEHAGPDGTPQEERDTPPTNDIGVHLSMADVQVKPERGNISVPNTADPPKAEGRDQGMGRGPVSPAEGDTEGGEVEVVITSSKLITPMESLTAIPTGILAAKTFGPLGEPKPDPVRPWPRDFCII